MIRLVNKVIKIAIMILLIGLMMVVALQVFSRFLLPQSPSWTEEVARFLMLHLVAAGSGLAFYRSMFINVDLFVQGNNSSKPFSRILQIFSRVVIFFTMIVIGSFSWNMIKLGITQTSAVLRLPMIFIFVVMAIIPLSIIVVQLYQLIHYLQKRK